MTEVKKSLGKFAVYLLALLSPCFFLIGTHKITLPVWKQLLH